MVVLFNIGGTITRLLVYVLGVPRRTTEHRISVIIKFALRVSS